jgi:hypothetical protein
MITLIRYSNSRGEQGRCDAKCYNAQHPECSCICGGANHGVGRAQATENTRRMAETWIEEHKQRHGGEAYVNETIYQLRLL